MSRAGYGPWLAGVDDAMAAQALCAAGFAAAFAPELLHGPHTPVEISGLVIRRWIEQRRPTPARWADPRMTEGWDPAQAPTAAAFAESWTQQVGGTLGYPARLVLDPAPDADRLRWVVAQLAREGNASTVVPLPEAPNVPPPWRFPLRIGVLAGPAGRKMYDDLLRVQRQGSSDWRRRLLEVVVVGRERVACDFLLVTGGPDAAAVTVRGLREVRSQVVLVADDPGSGDGRRGALSLAETTGAWAVGLGATAEPGAWVIELCRELTHNLGLDVAFLNARSRISDGLLFARPDIVAGQLLARGARAAAAKVADALSADVGPEDETGLEGYDLRGGGLPEAHLAALTDLPRLSWIAQNGLYQFESGEATKIDVAVRRSAPLTEYAAARRFLRTEISAVDTPGITLDGFRPGTEHRISVDVGPFLASRLLPAVPLDTLLPPTEQRLKVVLTEPTLLDAPLAAWLDLPALGSSKPVMFRLTTRPDTVTVDARLIVLSGNRVVQTVRLPHKVDGTPAVVARTPTAMETAISPLSADLADRRTFDAAFVVDSANHAASRATAVAGTVAASIRLDDLTVKAAVDLMTHRLGDIVASPEDYGALDAPGSVELLRVLAMHGWLMADALLTDSARLREVLTRSKYVQVVSARPDTFFPFELCYDFPAPDADAVLCPHAAAALVSDDLDATCPAEHDSTTVCPFGFWALNRVIERHAYQENPEVGTADFLLTSGPGVYRNRIPLGSSVVAASGRVDTVAAGSIDSVVGALEALGATRKVVDWTEWQQAIAANPALLLLLPHTVFDDPTSLYGLEIGAAARLLASKINKQFVPPSPVIVVLLGCETARAGSVGYERFPALLRRAGAKVVVATLTEILGRHAAPVAAAFVQELYAACGDQPAGVGDVMVRLRRRMLARGIPAVLALAVFGDADWGITTGGH